MVKWRDEVCNYYSYVQDYLTVQARQQCPTKSTLQALVHTITQSIKSFSALAVQRKQFIDRYTTSCASANNSHAETIKYLISKYLLHILNFKALLDIKCLMLSIIVLCT
jgi:hypothetical protein